MTTEETIRTLEWLLAESKHERESDREYYSDWIRDLRAEFVADHHMYTWLLEEARWWAEAVLEESDWPFPWEYKWRGQS